MRCRRVGVSAFAILLELDLPYGALAKLGSRTRNRTPARTRFGAVRWAPES